MTNMEDNQMLEDLKEKVQHLEYNEIKVLREDVNQIKVDLGKNNLLTEQMINSNDKLSDAISTMKEAMIEVKDSIKNTNDISKNLTNEVGDLSKKVDTMEEKITKVDNKGKFEVVSFISKNIVPIIAVLGVLIYWYLQIK